MSGCPRANHLSSCLSARFTSQYCPKPCPFSFNPLFLILVLVCTPSPNPCRCHSWAGPHAHKRSTFTQERGRTRWPRRYATSPSPHPASRRALQSCPHVFLFLAVSFIKPIARRLRPPHRTNVPFEEPKRTRWSVGGGSHCFSTNSEFAELSGVRHRHLECDCRPPPSWTKSTDRCVHCYRCRP